MKFILVTWNIHKCIGGVDRRYRPSRVIETLLHYKPDIVFLQEVDEGAKRSQFHRQVDVLGDALGMRHRCYGPNHRMREGHYGNAILSRWPLFDVTNMDLTIGNRKDRGVLHARARVYLKGHLRTLVLYNLHLGLSGKERGLQLERYLRSHPFRGLHHQTPVVLAGDFNDVWGSLGPAYLEPAGFRRAGSLVNTFPAILPVRPLDGIFVRGDLRVVHSHRAAIPVARQASDHLPLVSELVLTAGDGKDGA